MVVELMANIPPKKSRSISLQPNNQPTSLPTLIIQIITSKAAMMGCHPIFMIRLKENSKPNVNIRKITPIWLQSLMLVLSIMDGV